jgi:hypothetical protein
MLDGKVTGRTWSMNDTIRSPISVINLVHQPALPAVPPTPQE